MWVGHKSNEVFVTETQLAIAIKCFGVSVSYLIICKVCPAVDFAVQR